MEMRLSSNEATACRQLPPSILAPAAGQSLPSLLSLPWDTAFLLDLLLDLVAARADISPQLFCLASEILFILQGTFFFFFKLGILNVTSSQNPSEVSPSSWHSPLL